MSSIYLYLNSTDLIGIVDFLSLQGIFRLKTGEAVDAKKPCSFGIDETIHLTYSPCSYCGSFMQPGFFRVSGNDPTSKNIFNALKKHIKTTFLISKAKTFYIGPGMYNEWLSGKHTLPVLFDYEQVIIPNNQMSPLLEAIAVQGFKFQFTSARLRVMNTFEFPCEAFIIYSREEQLKHLLINKSTIRYIYGSECIFVENSKNKNSYLFTLDRRILQNRKSDITSLFQFIKEYS